MYALIRSASAFPLAEMVTYIFAVQFARLAHIVVYPAQNEIRMTVRLFRFQPYCFPPTYAWFYFLKQ